MAEEQQSPQQSQSKDTLIPGVKHVIAISSGKGGVGKSTVAANLACGLALTGAKVGLMDADLYGPNIPMMMGSTTGPEQRDGKIVPVDS
jgi:ATP-binding protein involved in chromosome partitioning